MSERALGMSARISDNIANRARQCRFRKMTFDPTPRQRLFLLQLLFAGGSAGMKDLKPAFMPADRSPLKTSRLLDERKVKRSLEFSLTDAGWKWVEDHLTDSIDVGRNTTAAAGALQQMLPRMAAYLAAMNVRLADFVRTKQAAATQALPDQPQPGDDISTGIKSAIAAACLRLGGGQDRQRLRLADVRKELGEWDRPAQDRALLELATAGRVVMYGMSDPQEIQVDDRDAEFRTPSGEARHLIYWTGSRAEAAAG